MSSAEFDAWLKVLENHGAMVIGFGLTAYLLFQYFFKKIW
jgi:hypothetical protein